MSDRAGRSGPTARLRAAITTRGGRRTPSTSAPPQVVLMTRAGCGLCRRAQALIEREAGDASLHLVDVDTDERLATRYGVRVPVVLVDDVEVAELELAPGQVRAAVRSARTRRALGPPAARP